MSVPAVAPEEVDRLCERLKKEAEAGLGEFFDLKSFYIAANILYHLGVEKYFKEKGARMK